MDLFAQENSGGIVSYQQITRYDFGTLFGIDSNSFKPFQEWLAGLPKEDSQVHILYFNKKEALFQVHKKGAVRNKRLQVALMNDL